MFYQSPTATCQIVTSGLNQNQSNITEFAKSCARFKEKYHINPIKYPGGHRNMRKTQDFLNEEFAL